MAGGFFLVLEGADGVGKSTQCDLLEEDFNKAGFGPCLRTREPTYQRRGALVRKLAMAQRLPNRFQVAKWLSQDRFRHVETVIKPALESGRLVIQDRYFYSTMAYQGANRTERERIKEWNERFVLVPDVVVVLDTPTEELLSRLGKRAVLDEFEQQDNVRRVADAYRAMWDEGVFGANAVRLDGTFCREELCQRIAEQILILPEN